MRGVVTALCLGSSLSWAAACGDDEGAVQQTSLGDLSRAQTDALCDDVAALIDRLESAYVDVNCTHQGRINPATCELGRRMCIDRTEGEGSFTGVVQLECTGASYALTEQCASATFAEVTGCLEALANTIEKMASQITCDLESTKYDVPSLPKRCVDVGARCRVLSGFRLD